MKFISTFISKDDASWVHWGDSDTTTHPPFWLPSKGLTMFSILQYGMKMLKAGDQHGFQSWNCVLLKLEENLNLSYTQNSFVTGWDAKPRWLDWHLWVCGHDRYLPCIASCILWICHTASCICRTASCERYLRLISSCRQLWRHLVHIRVWFNF